MQRACNKALQMTHAKKSFLRADVARNQRPFLGLETLSFSLLKKCLMFTKGRQPMPLVLMESFPMARLK